MEVMAAQHTNALTITPHPLTLDDQRHYEAAFEQGEKLLDFLRRHVPDIDDGWIVTIGGYEVPRDLWGRITPKPGVIIECRTIVRKDALKLAAVVVLSYYTLGAGGLAAATKTTAAGLFATGGAIGGGFFAAAATFVAGSLIINKVLGPKVADVGSLRNQEASPTYNITGGNNRARPYEPLQLLFGELRVTPDYAAIPYTFFSGDDQDMCSTFHAGINCHKVGEIKIGQTPVESYDDVTTRFAGLSGMTNEQLEGWGNVDMVDGAQLLNEG